MFVPKRLTQLLPLATLLLTACGDAPTQRDASGTPQDDAGKGDASMIAATNVRGVLDGAAYTLRYAAVKWPIAGDPRTWVCAANVPVTFEECQAGTTPRVMFMGPFVYNENEGSASWALAEVGVFRVGSSPVSAYARSGTLSVVAHEQASGSIALSMEVMFDDGPATGTVSTGD